MTVGPADDTALRPGDPMNGFGLVFAVGQVAVWLFGYDLPGAPQTQGGSDDTHSFIWPARPRCLLAAVEGARIGA
jgi:hypothetical protein